MTTRATSGAVFDRRTFLLLAGTAVSLPFLGTTEAAERVGDWARVLDRAKGQTVYWHAWGGDTRINDYITWVSQTAEQRFGIVLKHVKVNDTGTVVQAVLAEKSADASAPGSVDLVWINGENFASMKQLSLLLSEAWADQLPNFRFVDVKGKPTTVTDFTIPTDGLEAPWGMAQLVFFYDSAVLRDPPRSLDNLVAWTKLHPGRFTYPMPPDFVGSTFLKQILTNVSADAGLLARPVEEASFRVAADAVFSMLDAMHPNLWRQGKSFPQSSTTLRQLLADGEIDIAFAFNPAAASNAIAAGELPDTVRSFVFETGTIGNTHFVAIPFNSRVVAGAWVVADFLMSPEAQARKQDPNIWGDPTILDISSLDAADSALFQKLDLGVASLRPEELGKALPEPHPSWMVALETEWLRRYSS